MRDADPPPAGPRLLRSTTTAGPGAPHLECCISSVEPGPAVVMTAPPFGETPGADAQQGPRVRHHAVSRMPRAPEVAPGVGRAGDDGRPRRHRRRRAAV